MVIKASSSLHHKRLGPIKTLPVDSKGHPFLEFLIEKCALGEPKENGSESSEEDENGVDLLFTAGNDEHNLFVMVRIKASSQEEMDAFLGKAFQAADEFFDNVSFGGAAVLSPHILSVLLDNNKKRVHSFSNIDFSMDAMEGILASKGCLEFCDCTFPNPLPCPIQLASLTVGYESEEEDEEEEDQTQSEPLVAFLESLTADGACLNDIGKLTLYLREERICPRAAELLNQRPIRGVRQLELEDHQKGLIDAFHHWPEGLVDLKLWNSFRTCRFLGMMGNELLNLKFTNDEPGITSFVEPLANGLARSHNLESLTVQFNCPDNMNTLLTAIGQHPRLRSFRWDPLFTRVPSSVEGLLKNNRALDVTIESSMYGARLTDRMKFLMRWNRFWREFEAMPQQLPRSIWGKVVLTFKSDPSKLSWILGKRLETVFPAS